MEEFNGLWKHSNKLKAFIVLKVDTIRTKKRRCDVNCDVKKGKGKKKGHYKLYKISIYLHLCRQKCVTLLCKHPRLLAATAGDYNTATGVWQLTRPS